MAALALLYKYIGPTFWALLPISMITWVLVLYVLYSVWNEQPITEWTEILLAHAKEISVLLGLLGSVYALTSSFQADGASAEEIRERMFFVLSTGFWSTIAGVLVSLEASIGLLIMKRT